MNDLLRTLQSGRRRTILRLVWDDELSAGDIHRRIGDVTFGAISQQLRLLTEAGLVTVRRDGRFRYYRAQPHTLGALRPWLEAMWADALTQLKLQAESAADSHSPDSRTSR